MKPLTAFVLVCCASVLGCSSRPPTQLGPFTSIQPKREPAPVNGAAAEAQPSATPESRKPSGPGAANLSTHRTRLVAASPMPAQSLGLYLRTEPRKGKMGEPYRVHCNVCLCTLNNTSIPIWLFPKVTLYAEQTGDFYPLRVIEGPVGGIWAPYSISGASLTLPRSPRPGTWKLFAVQEHSETLYERHLKDYTRKVPLLYVEEQDASYTGMWTNRLVSNVITVEYAEISPAEAQSAERVIQGLVEAGQYKEEFRQRQGDPIERPTE